MFLHMERKGWRDGSLVKSASAPGPSDLVGTGPHTANIHTHKSLIKTLKENMDRCETWKCKHNLPLLPRCVGQQLIK